MIRTIIISGILVLLPIITIGQDNYSGIRITKISAGNNQQDSAFVDIPFDTDASIELTYAQNYLHFDFEVDSLALPYPIFYKMVGLDYNWIQCNYCSSVQYAHLDGGEYTFLIRSGIPDGDTISFDFEIAGNIWHQWWFVPLLFLFLLAIISLLSYFFALYQLRQKVRSQLLIQKEKLSSMVDLTKGVAHEMQNPLNFVNNYSEVSGELLEELEESINEGDVEDSKDLLAMLTDNLKKINSHGNRASNIIRGMMDHARPSSGIKNPTNINDLVNKVIRKVVQEKKSDDPDFNFVFDSSFDENIPLLPIVPDDIERVIYNILKNAIYTIQEKKKDGAKSYQPHLQAHTKMDGRNIKIMITDNGQGIPNEIMEKIFQPFFTTKPTGGNTGLGLSMCFNIIKTHGGEIKVESSEGEGTRFIIILPM